MDRGERRRARHAAGSERPAGACLHRLRDVPKQLPRRPGAAPGGADAQRRANDAQSTCAVHERRQHGAMVARIRVASLLQRGHGFPLGGRRQRRGRARRRPRADRHAAAHFRRHAAQPGCVRAGRLQPDREGGVHLQRAARQLAKLRRAQYRNECPGGHAGRRPQTVAPRYGRYGREPARGGAVPCHRSCDGVGRLRLGLSRSHAQRALSPVPGRRDSHAGQRSARTGTAVRRRGWRSASSRSTI